MTTLNDKTAVERERDFGSLAGAREMLRKRLGKIDVETDDRRGLTDDERRAYSLMDTLLMTEQRYRQARLGVFQALADGSFRIEDYRRLQKELMDGAGKDFETYVDEQILRQGIDATVNGKYKSHGGQIGT